LVVMVMVKVTVLWPGAACTDAGTEATVASLLKSSTGWPSRPAAA
jgi:hypothetical protein